MAIKIEFTDEQYKTLLKLTYLGNWMVNSFQSDDIEEECDNFESYILSFASDAGLDHYVDTENGNQRSYPSSELEDELNIYIDRYNNDIFWDELIERLAWRDFTRHFSDDEAKKMTPSERHQKIRPLIKKYSDEFSEAGIANILLKKDLVS